MSLGPNPVHNGVQPALTGVRTATVLEPSWLETLDPVVKQLLASPEPTAIGYGPGLLALHNDAFATAIGAEPIAPGAPRTLRDLCAELWPRLAPLIDSALESGDSMVLEDQLLCRFRDGYAEEAYLRIVCGPLMKLGGAIAGVVVTITDNTDRFISVRRTAALRAITAGAAPKCSVDGACERAMAAVSRHPSDLPFALLYLMAKEHDTLRLVAAAGVLPGTAASPETIDLESYDGAGLWPLRRALLGEIVIVDDLLSRFGTLPAGDWPFAPRSAAVVPVTSPGRGAPEGVLICGVSARHAMDAPYRAFIDLIVNQIAAAIAGGRLHEEDERATQARAASRIARARRRARLQALKAKFAGALEERTRLAREIHDTLLQGVTGIAIQLRAVLPDVRTTPDTAATVLQSIVELAERTSREARQAVWDMRPSEHSRRDLPRYLEITARRLIASTPIQLSVSVTGTAQPLRAQRQVAIAGIVQEAIANAVRHAKPRIVHLQIVFESRQLRVSVVDDGNGFTVEQDFHSYEGHWGLLGMRERANEVGGALTVRSAPGSGTTVTLVLRIGSRARKTLRAVG
jgi:signal transduction histidine kinase